jgi:hypothetical protein
MRALDAREYLVDGFERRLAERVDVARGDAAEVDGTTDAVVDVVRFLMPLVRLEECAV